MNTKTLSSPLKNCGQYEPVSPSLGWTFYIAVKKPNTPSNFKNIRGMKFGRLKVLDRDGSNHNGQALWKCICDCGEIKSVLGKYLRSGHSRSCGCLMKEVQKRGRFKHGFAPRKKQHYLYGTWGKMIYRCHVPTSSDYQLYGGRGIKVCERWRNSFPNFLQDMGDRPIGTSLDRIDRNGNYEPSNCRWATDLIQGNNKRNNVSIEHGGKTKNLSEWAREIGISPSSLWARINRHGWSLEKALTTPVRNW